MRTPRRKALISDRATILADEMDQTQSLNILFALVRHKPVLPRSSLNLACHPFHVNPWILVGNEHREGTPHLEVPAISEDCWSHNRWCFQAESLLGDAWIHQGSVEEIGLISLALFDLDGLALFTLTYVLGQDVAVRILTLVLEKGRVRRSKAAQLFLGGFGFFWRCLCRDGWILITLIRSVCATISLGQMLVGFHCVENGEAVRKSCLDMCQKIDMSVLNCPG